MIGFLTDNDVPDALVVGLVAVGVDVIRVRDVGLDTAIDPDVLEWAANEGRVIVSCDRNTMTKHAYDRVKRGYVMLGVIIVPQSMMPTGTTIEELHIAAACATLDEFRDQVLYLPLR